MAMKQLICNNTGGGLKPSETPTAALSAKGYLMLTQTADEMILGDKWSVFYEDNPEREPVIELYAASNVDTAAYRVTRIGNTSARVKITSLFQLVDSERYIGKYSVTRKAKGLRLTKGANR